MVINSKLLIFELLLLYKKFKLLLIKKNEGISTYFDRLIDNLELYIIETDGNNNFFKSSDKPLIKKNDYKSICSLVPELSLALYTFFPDAFFPILFPERFDILMSILDVLDIPIPDIPKSSDKRGRLIFYNQICENIFNFSDENNLTPAETCACIYDFSLLLMEDKKEPESALLPEPTNIWLTGGSKADYNFFLKNTTVNSESVWTCNENTKRGDIIIMYVLYPHSCIHSIWRAGIDGVYTPFNFYNSRTKIRNGIIVPKVTLKELQSDHYFSTLPIVRKNFQGVNGIKFSLEDYSELKRIFKNKGFKTSLLPKLYNPKLEFSVNLNNEKDVEDKLVIPLLKELGYTQNDWKRQLLQKVGRNEKTIPDFVILPKGKLHFQNSPMIIEVKYDFSSNIQQTKTFNQGLSYARIMKASYFAICDKNKFILYKENKGYFERFNPIFEKYWHSLNDPEIFSELKLLIGVDIFKSLSEK